MSPEPPAGPAPTRRDCLDRLLGVGAGVAVAGMVGPAAAYLWPAAAGGGPEASVDVGPLADLPVGGARLVQARGQPVLVLRPAADVVRAFSAICTHLGCVVRWDAGRGVIACPCHAASFAPTGAVLSGPPPRPLAPLPVAIVDGVIRLGVRTR